MNPASKRGSPFRFDRCQGVVLTRDLLSPTRVEAEESAPKPLLGPKGFLNVGGDHDEIIADIRMIEAGIAARARPLKSVSRKGSKRVAVHVPPETLLLNDLLQALEKSPSVVKNKSRLTGLMREIFTVQVAEVFSSPETPRQGVVRLKPQ